MIPAPKSDCTRKEDEIRISVKSFVFKFVVTLLKTKDKMKKNNMVCRFLVVSDWL